MSNIFHNEQKIKPCVESDEEFVQYDNSEYGSSDSETELSIQNELPAVSTYLMISNIFFVLFIKLYFFYVYKILANN